MTLKFGGGTMKKLFIAFISVIMLCSVACLAGCTEEPKSDPTRYDVVVQVRNSLGDHWIFDLDTSELTWETAYTGAEIEFMFDSFKLPDHPEWPDDWLTFDGNYHDLTSINCFYYDEDGAMDESTAYRPAKEKGEYRYEFRVRGLLMKYRAVRLVVTVGD